MRIMSSDTQSNGQRLCSYVLITPARNEEQYIRKTIEAVISQTLLPRRWIIVSDGSTDRTDAIVSEYLPGRPWMQLIRREKQSERNFASKAASVNAGLKALETVEYDVVGNLDADITFGSTYFESLMERFAADPELGVAGSAFVDDSMKYNYDFVGIEHVSGMCQLFRRKCFAQIGGYQHIPGGGVDLVAVTTARMKGWKTRTFTDLSCRHHRKMGTSLSGPIRLHYRYGAEDYYLGSHPLWEILRCVRHLSDRPLILSSLSLLAGYSVSYIRRIPRPVPEEFVRFRRREQMTRLKRIVLETLVPDAFRTKFLERDQRSQIANR